MRRLTLLHTTCLLLFHGGGDAFSPSLAPFSSRISCRPNQLLSQPHPPFNSRSLVSSKHKAYPSNDNENARDEGSKGDTMKEQTTSGGMSSSRSTASSNASTDTSSSEELVPSYRKLTLFAFTTILIWVSEPLLSLVDTTVVGQTAKNAVVQLAALGPATMLIDNCLYLTYFLAIAATNTIARALSEANMKKLVKTSSEMMGVAVVLGCVVTAVIFGAGQPLLWKFAGASRTAELVQLSMDYARIRSIVAPIAILGMVAQAICLASLDTVTPTVAVVVASVINIFGDIFLVGMRNMGIQGAAWATAAASCSASLVLLRSIHKKMQRWKDQSIVNGALNGNSLGTAKIAKVIDGTPIMLASLTEASANSTDTKTKQMKEAPVSTSKSTKPITISGDEAKGTNPKAPAESTAEKSTSIEDIPFISLPADRKSLVSLIKLAGPIFFVIVGKIVCYSAMTQRATAFGITTLACHNIMLRVFFFFCTFGDAFSQTSQSFLPNLIAKTKSTGATPASTSEMTTKKKKTKRVKPITPGNPAVKKFLKKLLLLSTSCGLLASAASQWILRYGGTYFTKEPAILNLMSSHTTYMSLALLLHPFILLLEGAIISNTDLYYLVANYAITIGLLMGLLKVASNSFTGVWRALFIFQVIRLLQFSWRVWNKIVRRPQSSAGLSAKSIASP